MNKDWTHGNVAHGGGSVHVWGGFSLMGKTSLCVLDQMLLEPFIAEFWRNNWLLVDDKRVQFGGIGPSFSETEATGTGVQHLWQQIPL